jgi:predicted transcriptional regulator
MSIPNDELQKILNHLNDKNKIVAKSFLSWLLENQLDDESDDLTDQDIQAIEKGKKDFESGKTITMEDLKHKLT